MAWRWFACAFVAAVAVGLVAGGGVQSALDRAAQARQDDLESRILALVVERHPGATVRDFLRFPKVVLQASAAAGVDYRLVLAMIEKESGFDPRAVGPAGEIGLMQLLPATAASVVPALGEGAMYTPPVLEPHGRGYRHLGSLADPEINVRLGVAYLRQQMDRFEPFRAAVRAYNRSPQRALDSRPRDRYAEDVALAFLDLSRRLPAALP